MGTTPNIWNSLLNTRGSLLGGNTFRDNGNGTFEVTRPPPWYEVSTTNNSVQQLLRFTPMDLYVLGFMTSDEVRSHGPLQSFAAASPAANLHFPPGLQSFDASTGPSMGVRISGVTMRASGGMSKDAIPRDVDFGTIVAANGGERSPSAAEAPHHIRQMWVLVTKPEAMIKLQAENDAKGDAAMIPGKEQPLWNDQKAQIDVVQKYRREWGMYFYKLTGWKGRLVTTFEGDVDDIGYWEFGAPNDDKKTVKAVGGAQVEYPGYEKVGQTPNLQSVLRVNVGGGEDGIRFEGTTMPLRINGDQKIGAPDNFITIRMRIPENPKLHADLLKDFKGVDGKKKTAPVNPLFARVAFEGGPEVTLPNLPDVAFLIPDGKWRNYSANLGSLDGFDGRTFPAFTLFPASQPIDGIEIEFVRISNSAEAKDTDKDCKGKERPDGWIDAEDNCKTVFNPFQEDGNGDGIGDACEDYDGDNVINACDNCPTLTNSRQRDKDGDGRGDTCDDEPLHNTCVIQPDSIGGRMGRPSALIPAMFLLVAGVGVVIYRRRRR
jgi:hypothetical protein